MILTRRGFLDGMAGILAAAAAPAIVRNVMPLYVPRRETDWLANVWNIGVDSSESDSFTVLSVMNAAPIDPNVVLRQLSRNMAETMERVQYEALRGDGTLRGLSQDELKYARSGEINQAKMQVTEQRVREALEYRSYGPEPAAGVPPEMARVQRSAMNTLADELKAVGREFDAVMIGGGGSGGTWRVKSRA